MEVGGEVEDRPNGEQEYGAPDGHQILPSKSRISRTIAITPRTPPATATLSRTSTIATMINRPISPPTMKFSLLLLRFRSPWNVFLTESGSTRSSPPWNTGEVFMSARGRQFRLGPL